MTDVVIHGHFYQPPRENPWTEIVDREPSAHPYHDWNERIHAECYRSNAVARILDEYGRVEGIVNNYAHLSFNFGPTLLAWLERHDPDAYARILEADRQSVRRHDGHGNAIAQAYNHAILPLCNEKDRRTQVRWGLADFRSRFGREPESLWLAETACHEATLETLIDEGLSYVILSPHQAQRVRAIGEDQWTDVSDGSVDPRVAYRYAHRDGSGRSIALFFYDGAIARGVGFEHVLSSSQSFVSCLCRGNGEPGKVVHVATDGESYGHHTRLGERGLAYALMVEGPARGLTFTNYASYLAHNPATMETEIKPGPDGEGTAWSCAHGVGRWYRDCGCHTGGREGWNQAWRGPLRQALDHIRDEAAGLFSEAGALLLADPWKARDEYIDVVLDPGLRDEWLDARSRRRLDGKERVRALTLLEMQRNALLMYTSCGWFFTEVSGIETVQILKYAARALDYIDELGHPSPKARFLEILAEAKSNLPGFGTGADVFRRFVEPSRVAPDRVAVSLAVSSLMDDSDTSGEEAGFAYRRTGFRKQQLGRLTMTTGRLELEHIRTASKFDYARLAIHLGGVDFYCAMKPFESQQQFDEACEVVWTRFAGGSIPELLRIACEHFGPEEHGFESVLAGARQRISALIHGEVVDSLASEYGRVYRQSERVIQMLEEAGVELPPELRAAADLSLTRQLQDAIRDARERRTAAAYQGVIDLARRIARLGHRITHPAVQKQMETLLAEAVEEAVAGADVETVASTIGLVEIAMELHLEPSIERAQEVVAERLRQRPWPLEIDRLATSLRLSARMLDERATDESGGSAGGRLKGTA